MCGKTSRVVGEVYRIPNANGDTSIDDHENILSRMKAHSQSIILGTNQNFAYLKTKRSQVNIVLVRYIY